MRPSILLVFTMLLGCALPAFAQTPATQPPIEQAMTPEQFKAAGLDKLSADELANLNSWLNRTITTETAKAAEKAAVQATEKVETENRGFFHFGSSEPIEDRIAGQFNGFRKGNTYTLDNGQQWRQTDTASLAGVRMENPAVKITPSLIGNTWYLRIDGYNTRAKVERVK
ncbi:MAG: hypothetical protein L0H23_13685 [Luteimonas sp.]|nr:hypothetical protein [Luteimonas sp.]